MDGKAAPTPAVDVSGVDKERGKIAAGTGTAQRTVRRGGLARDEKERAERCARETTENADALAEKPHELLQATRHADATLREKAGRERRPAFSFAGHLTAICRTPGRYYPRSIDADAFKPRSRALFAWHLLDAAHGTGRRQSGRAIAADRRKRRTGTPQAARRDRDGREPVTVPNLSGETIRTASRPAARSERPRTLAPVPVAEPVRHRRGRSDAAQANGERLRLSPVRHRRRTYPTQATASRTWRTVRAYPARRREALRHVAPIQSGAGTVEATARHPANIGTSTGDAATMRGGNIVVNMGEMKRNETKRRERKFYNLPFFALYRPLLAMPHLWYNIYNLYVHA